MFQQYLPEIYKEDPVLLKLVGVLESVLVELEREIHTVGDTLYNPASTPLEFLSFVGGLVGLAGMEELLTPEQIRRLLPLSLQLQRHKGTRQALFAILGTVLEEVCSHPVELTLVEYRDWQCMSAELVDRCPELYGGEEDFTVLAGPEPGLQNRQAQALLEVLAREYSPAFAVPHVVVAEDQARPGTFSYLDYNTYL